MPEQGAVVFPMVKHPFVVGFLVAELQMMKSEEHDFVPGLSSEEARGIPPGSNMKSWEIETFDDERMRMYKFTSEQKLNAVNICRSLAMAYVMDQVDYLWLNRKYFVT